MTTPIVNPKTMSWKHDGKNTDGSAFDPTLFGGWDVRVNGTSVVSIPIGWNTSGQYSAPISDLNLTDGTYSVDIALVALNGNMSAYSTPVSFVISTKVPNAPLELTVA